MTRTTGFLLITVSIIPVSSVCLSGKGNKSLQHQKYPKNIALGRTYYSIQNFRGTERVCLAKEKRSSKVHVVQGIPKQITLCL